MRTRTNHVSIWLNDKELLHLKKLSEKSGLKVDPLIRSLIKGQQIKAKPTGEYIAILRELSAIGNNINQIARVANTNGSIRLEEILRAVEMVNKMWKYIKETG
jgi:hypothetical protein